MQNKQNKEKRIDKEIFLLRNLPKQFKMGKKETQLGILIDLEIDRATVPSKYLDKSVERFYFDILLRDKYPFQPPIIMTRTTFCTPTLADGRDLLYEIIPKTAVQKDEESKESEFVDISEESAGGVAEWRPSMNLFDLIKSIPAFINRLVEEMNGKNKASMAPSMIGKFYLGLNYDYQQIWMQNQSSRPAAQQQSLKDSRARDSGVAIYPCIQEKEYAVTNEAGEKVFKKVNIDVYVVISESVFLMLEPEPKMKGIGKLVSWGTLPTIDNIKRNLDNPDFLRISWRKVDYKEPWSLSILLPNNANDCVTLILRHLKKQGLVIDKKYEKKKKLQEKDVTAEGVLKKDKVEQILVQIQQYEKAIQTAIDKDQAGAINDDQIPTDSTSAQVNASTVQHLISLYNKAIEYYSALNDEKHIEYLQKLQKVLQDEKMQKMLGQIDQA